jgi:hypothetical protein
MRKCAVCEKGSTMVGTRKLLRGHYNPTNWSRKYPNLQKTRDKDGEKILACIKCLRTLSGKKEAKLASNKKARETAALMKKEVIPANPKKGSEKKAKAKKEKTPDKKKVSSKK